ncbi:MAG: hypothetical protein E6K10_09055 [Methanobacteriota archaeon]|nr:MAG: hypothetical protein E6K10_09055 [Euryarchaeota archaeon]
MAISKFGSGVVKDIAITAAVVALAFVMALPPVATAWEAPPCTGGYSGRAIGVWVHAAGDTTFADTGPLPPEGGFISATPVSVDTGTAAAAVLLSVTSGLDGVAESEASSSDVVLVPNTAAEVRAEFVRSHTVATTSGIFGESEISSLWVGGHEVVVTGQPNQNYYVVGVFTLVINEQLTLQTETCNSITVNALHLWFQGIEIVVSSAHSDITIGNEGGCGGCGETQPHDFVTGGGWIWQKGYHANFGFVAGYKPGNDQPLRGNLNFIDHGDGMHVKATSVDTYTGEGNWRQFTGHAMIDGSGDYTYTCYVEDNGEPGHGVDYFRLSITETGYNAEDYLAGGNIQIHAK